jgi:hypothetical protein
MRAWTVDLPSDLRDRVEAYFTEERIDPDLAQRVDVILALLTINTTEALRVASHLGGFSIKKCPPAVPLWPPAPVQGARLPRITRVEKNPCLPTTGAFQRFRQIRRGMTRTQLLGRGLTTRDLRLWERAGFIAWSH